MYPLPFPPLSKNYLFEVKRFVAFCRNSISSQICKLFSHKNCISIHTSSRKLSCTFGRLKNDKCSIWSICEKFKVLYSPIYLQKSAPIQPKFLVTGGYEAVASPRQLELSTRNLPENKTHWDPEVAGCFLCSYQNPSQLSQRSLMQRLDISPTKCVVVTEEKGTWKKRYNWISSFLRFSRILNWSIRASVPRLYILLVCSRCSFVFGCSFQHC